MEDINERSVIRPNEVPVQLSLKLTEDQVLEIMHAFIREVMGGEPRPHQDEGFRAVWRALRNDEKHLIQAGTGTGKTLMLLLSLLAGKRTVMTTGTKSLQSQVERDAPVLIEWLFERFGIRRSMALMLGKSSFVCLDSLESPSLTVSPDDVKKVRAWLEDDERGAWVDGPWLPASTRAELSTTADTCLGKACDYYDDCYVYRAKAKADEADLVVANHALLGVNIASGGMVLPDHDAIFADECHQLDSFVANALGVEFRFSARGETERGTVAAAITATRSLLPELNVLDGMSAVLPEVRKHLEVRMRNIDEGRIQAPDFDSGIADIDSELWQMLAALANHAERASAALGTLPIMQSDLKTRARRDKAKGQMNKIAHGISRMAHAQPGQITFLQRDGDTLALKMVDVRIGDILDQRAWHYGADPDEMNDEPDDYVAPQRAVVLCSATIPPNYHREVGMDDAHLHDLGTPFDYANDVLLYVPGHLTPPSGKGGNSNKHRDEAIAEGIKLIREALDSRPGRGVLVLSTSIGARERRDGSIIKPQWREGSVRWADEIEKALPGVKIINPLRAEEKNAAIAEAMSTEQPFVICASQGWQEGVDLPGKLSLVIIDKAPMAPPTDPIMKAKQALAGDGAFNKVVVPYVAAKLGQAAGRLMRRHGDGGVIAILDPRMRNAGWTGKPAARTGLWAKLPPAPNTTSLNEALEFLRTGTRAQVPAPLEFAPAAPRRAPSVVPLGRYAVVLEDGETALYEVSMGEGVLEGLRVADRIVERRKVPTRRPESITALRLIAEQGIEESAARYGQITEECGQCHRKLTDPESIAIGIGPDCRRKMLAEAAA